jgi:hypothetical protein
MAAKVRESKGEIEMDKEIIEERILDEVDEEKLDEDAQIADNIRDYWKHLNCGAESN